MRLRNIPGAGEVIDNSPYCIKEPVELKGKWHDFLGNNNPIHIEVGMGKGRFLMDLARLHPEINYIGIERYTSVLLRAVQKMQEDELPNVHFLCIDAATLPDIFDRNEVDRIYLNFSDPWPKERHTKRRLTSPRFLARYDSIFKDKKHIIMKTDNIDLFNYSVESLKEYGYNINDISNDLHSYKDNIITTEYEDKFTSKGIKINYFDASKN